MARNWMVVLSLPRNDGAITSPSEAITPRRPISTSSRPTITATIHADARSTPSRAMSTPDTNSLSAVVSRNEPKRVVTFQRRASRPSSQSVAAAMTNSTAATASAPSPPSSTRAITTGVRTIRTAVPAASMRAQRSPPRVRSWDATGGRMLPAHGRVRAPQTGLDGRDPGRRHAELADAEADEAQRDIGVPGELAAHADPATVSVGRGGHRRDELEDRLQALLEQVRQRGVAALGRHRVLRQVVGPDREEGDGGSEPGRRQRRRGHLDHRADLELGARGDLLARGVEQVARGAQLARGGNHGEHHRQ